MSKRLIALFLCVAMVTAIIPIAAVSAFAEGFENAYTIKDEFISVSVSKKNGGFIVKTEEGDRLKKSDNNKALLYHDGSYDTSFLSFRVGEGETAKEYIFGGKYDGSSDVAVTMPSSKDRIEAVWSVGGITFTQTITLSNKESNESGMVSITVNAKNQSGNEVPVKARVLLDTYLGSQDFGYYQYVNENHDPVTVNQERVIEGDNIPTQIYAADDQYSPGVMAYTINTGKKPNKIAIGHWNRLASTLYDFSPVENLDFTNTNNEFWTSDSAYALYYDLGSVANGGESTFNTFYGVFSNYSTPIENSVAINLTAPVRLELNDSKTDFKPLVNIGESDFSVAVDFTNIKTDAAIDRENVLLAVQTSSNLCVLDDKGMVPDGYDFYTIEPFTFSYSELKVGQNINKDLHFKAKVSSEAQYERITIGVYDASATAGQLSEDYKLGERTAYVLLPGSDSDLPKVTFAAMTPKIIYNEGTRHLFVTVTNETLLTNRANWSLKAYTEDGKNGINIPHTNINIKDGIMDVALTDDMKLAEGGWYLQLEWAGNVIGDIIPKEQEKQSGPELHFIVSNDKKYKNDSYGILAVIEYDGYASSKDKKEYRIIAFADEEEFKSYKENPEEHPYGNYSEIVLKFKGEFTASKKKNDLGTYYTAVSTKEYQDGKAIVDNPIVINDCLEFEDGSLNVYYEDYEGANPTLSAVCTEFDGKLYTQGARTDVWSGRAVLTKLKQHEFNYSLAPYDENGERISLKEAKGDWSAGDESGFTDHPICLMWPSRGAVGRTLSGLLFNFAYGQLGVMYDTDEHSGIKEIKEQIGTVVSFAAALDLSFVSKQTGGEAPDDYWTKIQELWRIYNDKESPYKYTDDLERVMKAKDWKNVDESDNKNEKKASASVMVRDVIFGCGKGFVGVNFSVGVALKNYVTGLPEIEGNISVNTVNNWAYGLDGKIDLEVFRVEAEVSFRSKNNVPVPDNFYVFVSGVQPGINIDGLGVCWITGGGGGINNLYDTLFETKKVPPLKLLLSVSFEILKVLECEKATFSIGPTGIGLNAEGIGVKAVPGLTAFDKIGLNLEWYPGIDLRANIVVNLFAGLIRGGGYMVLISPDYKDVFFEIFARASVNVPESIPIVGGIRVGGVDLGINSEKVWGAMDVLMITLGITYYWGSGDVDFGSGNKTHPTFPELLGYSDIPIQYDAENNRTLYARIGTNTQLMASNLPDDGKLILMNVSGAKLNSDIEKAKHTFNLGTVGDSDAIVQVVFAADSLEDAKAKGAGIKVGSADGANDFGLVLFDLNANNLETANANLTYDSETKKATMAFTVTEADKYNKLWYMNTPKDSDVLLYNVAAVPEVSSVGGSINGDEISLNWDGSSLSELDKISFYLCENNNPEETDAGYRIGVVEDSSILASKNTTLAIPPDVPGGDYYIRAVYSKSNEVNGVLFSDGTKLKYVNNNTPGGVVISEVKPAGDLQYKLTLQDGGKTDGYLVTVYDKNGNPTDFEQVSFEKAENGATTVNVGGSYNAADPENQGTLKAYGLEGGKEYKIGVTPYKTVTSGKGEIAVRGKEVKTNEIYLPVPETPTVSFTADKTKKIKVVKEYQLNESGTPQETEVEKTVYTSKELTITADISEAASGIWKLNNGIETEFKNTSKITIPLIELEDGEQTLTIEGEAADGDSFSESYFFTTDTMPPQLLLSSPVNGSFFDKDGVVKFTGTTDKDALFKVTSDGTDIVVGKTVSEMGGTYDVKTGVFSFDLSITDPNGAAYKNLEISVIDDVGNASTPKSVSISHGGLADITSVEVMAGGILYDNGNIPIPATGIKDLELKLVGKMSDGRKFDLNGYNINWEITTVEGSAELSNNKLSAEAMSQGVVTGKLAVGDNAFRTAAVCFGAVVVNSVIVSSTIGGKVSGGGDYKPGEIVTLTAIPDSGYEFAGWKISGVTGVDLKSSAVKFTMPSNGNVVAEATFKAKPTSPSTISGGGSSGGSSDISGRYAEKGSFVTVKLPNGKTEKEYLPYYYDSDGEKVFVPISDVKDGNVRFIAPRTGRYYFGRNEVKFSDISGIWSEQSIMFNAMRNIFKGVGGEIFEPESSMDRAMVITVLYRLAGSPKVSGESEYTDVENNSWYSDAVIWGTNEGIVNGYGDGIFGTEDNITREQLCTMIVRFMDYMDYDIQETTEAQSFIDEADISDWAKDAVYNCQVCGFVNGMPEGTFEPYSVTTREQGCAVMERMIRAILNSKQG